MIKDVAIDMDGVLYDFSSAIHYHASAYLRRDLSLPTKWEFFLDWGMTHNEFYSMLEELTVEEEIFNQGSPYPLVKEGWKSLREQGLKIHIITHRAQSAYRQTTQWLERFQLLPDTLHFTDKKAHVLRAVSTDEYASLDDNELIHQTYVANHAHAFVMDRPWNWGAVGYRVDDLKEFADRIKIYNEYQRTWGH